MSASSREWDDWLWVPDMTAAEDKADVFEIVQADYDEDTVLRLFSTVERRLSQCVLHFDDFASDDRVVYAITSELVSVPFWVHFQTPLHRSSVSELPPLDFGRSAPNKASSSPAIIFHEDASKHPGP